MELFKRQQLLKRYLAVPLWPAIGWSSAALDDQLASKVTDGIGTKHSISHLKTAIASHDRSAESMTLCHSGTVQ